MVGNVRWGLESVAIGEWRESIFGASLAREKVSVMLLNVHTDSQFQPHPPRPDPDWREPDPHRPI